MKVRNVMLIEFCIDSMCVCRLGGRFVLKIVVVVLNSVRISIYSSIDFLWFFYIFEIL